MCEYIDVFVLNTTINNLFKYLYIYKFHSIGPRFCGCGFFSTQTSINKLHIIETSSSIQMDAYCSLFKRLWKKKIFPFLQLARSFLAIFALFAWFYPAYNNNKKKYFNFFYFIVAQLLSLLAELVFVVISSRQNSANKTKKNVYLKW